MATPHRIKPDVMECRQCGRTLPFDSKHFRSNNQHTYGLRVRCLDCTRPGFNQYGRERLQRIRVEVLTHYSGGEPICACCGEQALPFLSLDHIAGSSQEDYRRFGNSERFYSHIRREGFPPHFQCLCHNCNQCKRVYGYCVHRPPEGVLTHFPLYEKEWRLDPVEAGSPCIHCQRRFPRTINFFPRHRMMGDGMLHSCHDCHRHNQTRHGRGRKLRQKRLVFAHYSGGSMRCACCGVAAFELLCIDHADNDGREHRKQLNNSSIYPWLIKNNLPDKPRLQILCYSCNQARSYYGSCPCQKTSQ